MIGRPSPVTAKTTSVSLHIARTTLAWPIIAISPADLSRHTQVCLNFLSSCHQCLNILQYFWLTHAMQLLSNRPLQSIHEPQCLSGSVNRTAYFAGSNTCRLCTKLGSKCLNSHVSLPHALQLIPCFHAVTRLAKPRCEYHFEFSKRCINANLRFANVNPPIQGIILQICANHTHRAFLICCLKVVFSTQQPVNSRLSIILFLASKHLTCT